MQHLFLVNPDFSPFDKSQIETLLCTERRFYDVRTDLPVGGLLEAEFGRRNHWTRIVLSTDATAITLAWISTTALYVALLVRNWLGRDLRVFDTQYSFDLLLEENTTLADFDAAIDAAQREP